MMFCKNCNKEYDDKTRFCPDCGAAVLEKKQNVVFCQNCGSKFESNEKFCGNCGNKLTNPSSEIKKAVLFDNAIANNGINVQAGQSYNTNYGNYQSNYRDNKKKSHIPAIICCVFVFVLLGTIFLLTKDTIFNTKTGKRTIMVYMIGADLESKYFSATKDIAEMRDSNADFEKVNVLIYTGGATNWHSYNIPSDKHALYRLTNDGLELLEELGGSNNMLDPANLTYLLQYGYDNYKADYYSLILWDHGGGPIFGYGSDEYQEGKFMSLSMIKKALSDSPFGPERKLEYVGFDACLMASVEVAYSLVDYTDYLVASEEAEPGAGWDYGFLGEITPDTDTVTLTKSIVDYYDAYYGKYSYIKGVTLSVMRLNKIDNVEKYLNKLFENIDDNLDIDYSTITRTRKNSKSFGRDPYGEYTFDLIDLVDFANRLPEKYSEDVNNLKSSINDFVIYNKSDLQDSYGVSIYFPYEFRDYLSSIMTIYDGFGFARDYFKFISNFADKLTGKRMNTFDLSRSTVKANGEGNISITTTDDVAKNYSNVSYTLFIMNDNNTYTPIYNGSDVNVEGNTMSTTVSRKMLSITDGDGNILNLTALESEKGKDYVKYLIPITLSRFGDDYEYEVINAYIEFIVDEDHPKGYMGRVVPMNDKEDKVAPKVELLIEDYDIISFNSYQYTTLNGTNWQSTQKIAQMQLDTTESFTLEFSDLDISNRYYALFKIEDSQGNVTYSSAILVNNK